jgi:hypothetical protein
LSPCLVTQPIQKRLEPTAKLVSPIRRSANHGRPLQKADHPSVTEKVIWESRAREKSAKVALGRVLINAQIAAIEASAGPANR